MSLIVLSEYEIPQINEKSLEDLIIIANQLASLSQSIKSELEYVKTFSELRSSYLVKSLAPLAALSSSYDSKKNASYVKGSCVFLSYVQCFLKMIKVTPLLSFSFPYLFIKSY
jgi:hypothetical protein